jgi:hypothetical protein
MELLGDLSHVESHFGPFEDSEVSEQDRCMVYAEHTTGSKIILDTPD